MKRLLLTIIMLMLLSSSVMAVFDTIPDQAMLMSEVGTINLIDSFLVTATSFGVTVFKYNYSTSLYDFNNQLYYSFDSAQAHLFDSILVLKTLDNSLHFIDLSSLPELTYLGNVDINIPFADYLLIDSSLYLASYYEGIQLYDLIDYTEAVWADSSLKGVLVTQLFSEDNMLYALDEYNGLMKYDITQPTIKNFIDYLYIPKRANKFFKADNNWGFLLNEGGFYRGSFDLPYGSSIVDSIANLPVMNNGYLFDSTLILTSDRQVSLYNSNDLSTIRRYDLVIESDNGSIADLANRQALVVSDVNGGILFVPIDGVADPIQGLSHGSLIEDMIIIDNKLFISGPNEPIKVYDITDQDGLFYDYTIYPEISNSSYMTNRQDTLFAYYPQLNRIAVINGSSNPDSLFLEITFSIENTGVNSINFINKKMYNYTWLYIQHPTTIDAYLVSDSGYINYANTLGSISWISEFAVKDSTIYMATYKKNILSYTMADDFSFTFRDEITMTEIATASIVSRDRLYMFESDLVYLVNISDPHNMVVDTVIDLPLPVDVVTIIGNTMFTVGEQGMMAFDISTTWPVLIQGGSFGGNIIVADSNIIAISDGNGVAVYYHDIVFDSTGFISNDDGDLIIDYANNYPNPFNLETTINFNQTQSGLVTLKVYNILGQLVRDLLNKELPAGSHSVSWDGLNQEGREVSSGIYLYRITSGDNKIIRKMLLIK